MKRVVLLMILVLVVTVCSAPTLSEDIRKQRKDYIIRRFEEDRWMFEFSRWADHLGLKESGNEWWLVNNIGCFGEFQFQERTLQFLGFKVTLAGFKRDLATFTKDKQFEALKALTVHNMKALKDCECFVGTTVKGILITRSGMLGAAHLGGENSVRLFLKSGGKINRKDVNGTSIAKYLKEFQGYDL